MKYSEEKFAYLKKMAVIIRSNILEMIPVGKVGHFGGSCSIADILSVLYFEHMNVYIKKPNEPKRDRLIFSKGHAVLAQYACLVELGYFDRSELAKVKTLDGILQGHPDMEKTPGIEAVTGSLGQGLSVGLGMSLGLKLNKSDSRVFVICGDGELAEGQIWEAAMAASVYKADNLVVIVDWNGVQATDTTKTVFEIGFLKEKWEAFGWNVCCIDGHDIAEILSTLDSIRDLKGKPSVILAKTIKGKGFPFAEGKAQFHNTALNEEQYATALELLKKMKQEVGI